MTNKLGSKQIAVGICFVYGGTLILRQKIQVHYDWKPEQIQLYEYSWEGKEELIPVLSPCGHIFLLPPKPHMCPLCHFIMNVQLCNRKAKELCLVSTEFSKRLTGSKGIKNIWKHRLCIFLSS